MRFLSHLLSLRQRSCQASFWNSSSIDMGVSSSLARVCLFNFIIIIIIFFFMATSEIYGSSRARD